MWAIVRVWLNLCFVKQKPLSTSEVPYRRPHLFSFFFRAVHPNRLLGPCGASVMLRWPPYTCFRKTEKYLSLFAIYTEEERGTVFLAKRESFDLARIYAWRIAGQ